jgi:hypothetical protein
MVSFVCMLGVSCACFLQRSGCLRAYSHICILRLPCRTGELEQHLSRSSLQQISCVVRPPTAVLCVGTLHASKDGVLMLAGVLGPRLQLRSVLWQTQCYCCMLGALPASAAWHISRCLSIHTCTLAVCAASDHYAAMSAAQQAQSGQLCIFTAVRARTACSQCSSIRCVLPPKVLACPAPTASSWHVLHRYCAGTQQCISRHTVQAVIAPAVVRCLGAQTHPTAAVCGTQR